MSPGAKSWEELSEAESLLAESLVVLKWGICHDTSDSPVRLPMQRPAQEIEASSGEIRLSSEEELFARSVCCSIFMADYIEIKDLLLRTIIGINPEERDNRQDVLINLRLEADLKRPGQTDCIDDAVNYRTLCKQIIHSVENSSFQLVERLAEEIVRISLKFPGVLSVRVSVEKPGALRFARSVGVVLERRREEQ